MKRTKRIVCLLLAMALLLCTCSTAFAKVGEVYRVKGDGLHLRTVPKGGAGRDGNIIASLRAGRQVVHLASKGNWWKVRTGSGKVGWVFNAYLARSNSSGIAGKGAGIYRVKSSSLNVREAPDTASKRIGRLGKGRKVNIIAVKNGWGKIQNLKGQIGYISMAYVG